MGPWVRRKEDGPPWAPGELGAGAGSPRQAEQGEWVPAPPPATVQGGPTTGCSRGCLSSHNILTSAQARS